MSALDLFEPALRLLHSSSARPCASRMISLRFVLRRRLDFVGELLCCHERVAEVGLALAMLDEQRFAAHEVLPQPIDFAERVS